MDYGGLEFSTGPTSNLRNTSFSLLSKFTQIRDRRWLLSTSKKLRKRCHLDLGRPGIIYYQQWKQLKADRAEALRVEKEKEKEGGIQPGEDQSESDVEVVPQAGISRRLQNRENVKAENKKKKDAKKAAAKRKSQEDTAAVEIPDGEEGKSLFESLDSDMQAVAKKCKQYPRMIPQCLFHLDVTRILQGEKLGRSICKASYLVLKTLKYLYEIISVKGLCDAVFFLFWLI